MNDLTRYTCQIKLDDIGPKGQEKLRHASILCVGAGGLAATALPYLAGAGVGQIGIIDGDTVALRNLHRQINFPEAAVGYPKAAVMGQILQQQNSQVKLEIYPEFLTVDNAERIIKHYDLVIDCSDNFYTRYLINDICYQQNKPDVFAAVIGYEGLLTVFHREHGPCYRCLYPNPPALTLNRNCNDDGVFPTIPGLFGLLQATEALKIILGIGTVLYQNSLKMNITDWQVQQRSHTTNPDCLLCGKQTAFAQLPRHTEFAQFTALEINAEQLKQNWANYHIIDVREPSEYEQYNLGTPHLPFSRFAQLAEQLTLPKETKIAVVCAHGVRSKAAANVLRQLGYTDVTSLQGGLAAWQEKYA